jgi:hypothetical protein
MNRISLLVVALIFSVEGFSQAGALDLAFGIAGKVITNINNINAGNEYAFSSAIRADGKIIYRLKQKDIDGRFTYSKIVALSIDNKNNSVLFYPNPVIHEANLTITINRPEQVRARIIDNAGRVVKQQQWNLSAGSTSLSVDVKGLAHGLYYLELKGKTINEPKQFIKQ